jgi:hypothetical protein
MRFYLLLGVTFAGCGLPASIDPNGACVTDANGFATLDADSPGVPISIAISTKGPTTDTFRVDHPGTAGALTDDTATDGRYVLACKQAAGLKTVKMTVTRPADMTAFGAEWVQLFPKDSWANVTNEYEPFTFNEFGAKIPLQEFRPTSDHATDAADADVLNVFMEVSDEGDYELMYGNPALQSGGKWVAAQFKSTLLRVGTPWADCDTTSNTLGAATYEIGTIMPILFGGPNLNSIALAAGKSSYFDVITELAGATVPVKVVLEIFSTTKTTYTDSATDGVCYKAGNSCPEGHVVCKAEYCEMDMWKTLIADFKAAGSVTVLGSVDSSATQALYAGLALDGFYFTTDSVPGDYSGTSVLALGSPLFDPPDWESRRLSEAAPYKLGVQGVDECPAGYLPIYDEDGCLAATSYFGGERYPANDNHQAGGVCNKCGGCPGGNTFAINTNHGDMSWWACALDPALSSPTEASVYVTLAAKDLGVWNPFSWYPYVAPSKWAAIVTEATDLSAVEVLVDRGYGWIYVTTAAGFDSKSSIAMGDLLSTIEGQGTRRKLRARGLEASAPFWSCDDTLFACKPVCVKKTGLVTTKVSDTLCAAEPMDQCACKCYHSAQWTCVGESVVCMAKFGAGELQAVGDKVCETRGAPKPASVAELRVASQCEPMTEMRGSAPTAECLAQWETTPAPQESLDAVPTVKPSAEDLLLLEGEAFAATLALAAIALRL